MHVHEKTISLPVPFDRLCTLLCADLCPLPHCHSLRPRPLFLRTSRRTDHRLRPPPCAKHRRCCRLSRARLLRTSHPRRRECRSPCLFLSNRRLPLGISSPDTCGQRARCAHRKLVFSQFPCHDPRHCHLLPVRHHTAFHPFPYPFFEASSHYKPAVSPNGSCQSSTRRAPVGSLEEIVLIQTLLTSYCILYRTVLLTIHIKHVIISLVNDKNINKFGGTYQWQDLHYPVTCITAKDPSRF